MKIALRLRRISQASPTRALLLPGHDTQALLHLCARLGRDKLPPIYEVHDGFLLYPVAPTESNFTGLVRLTELAPGLLLPVDAELIPGLLPDEATALGRERGLVFLPEGRVLAFDLSRPLTLAQLLTTPPLTRPSWQALPEGPRLAERLHELMLIEEDIEPDAFLEQGGEGIGSEAPRPEGSSLPRRVLGGGVMGVGKGIAWLGAMLRIGPLARLGGKLMSAGANLAPRLAEKLFGKREAGLQELLKDFRSGDIEKALRRAVPLSDEAIRGGTLGGDARLPINDTTYSLANILRSSSGGSVWLTRDMLYQALREEYRKQALAATQRGDYRRAAFIYGRLLGDYRSAAAALAQGGLHRDAAVLYLKRLNDPLAAAREFEAAGDSDRALAIYREQGEHLRAGDLLRGLGEEEAALAEYRAAADLLVDRKGYLEAGDLLLHKTQRSDLARCYFEKGWGLRLFGAGVPCGKRLLDLDAQAHDLAALKQTVAEAEDYFLQPGKETVAGDFFNHVATLAQTPNLEPCREELRDRALVGLARQLHHAAQTPAGGKQLIPLFFGAGATWDAPLAHDAQYAATHITSRLTSAPVDVTQLSALIPVVSAVAQASETGELFVGFQSGEVFLIELKSGTVREIDRTPGKVESLAVSASGDMLVIHSGRREESSLSLHFREEGYRLAAMFLLKPVAPGCDAARWLVPTLLTASDLTSILWDGSRQAFLTLRGGRLLPERDSAAGDDVVAGMVPFPTATRPGLIAMNGHDAAYYPHFPDTKTPFTFKCPFPAPNDSLVLPPISTLGRGPERLEVLGVGEGGTLTWLELDWAEHGRGVPRSHSTKGPFAAATLIRSCQIAAADARGLSWLRVTSAGIREYARQRHPLVNVVACFPLHPARAVAVVTREGTIVRFQEPQ